VVDGGDHVKKKGWRCVRSSRAAARQTDGSSNAESWICKLTHEFQDDREQLPSARDQQRQPHATTATVPERSKKPLYIVDIYIARYGESTFAMTTAEEESNDGDSNPVDVVLLVDGFRNVVVVGNENAAAKDDASATDYSSTAATTATTTARTRTRSDDADDLEAYPLRWYCAPDSWSSSSTTATAAFSDNNKKREGTGGSWFVSSSSSKTTSVTTTATALTIVPPAKKDYWRKTYYEPLLVKDDGPFLYADLPETEEDAADGGGIVGSGRYRYYTVEAKFVLYADRQFDQAGIMVRRDSRRWIKAGIEVVDGQPRMSCVVTNDYSDWSTQPWSNYEVIESLPTKEGDDDGKTTASVRVEAEIRVHCRGTSFVVEARNAADEENGGEAKWEFIRIAHMGNSDATERKFAGDETHAPPSSSASPRYKSDSAVLRAGVFACCPEDQREKGKAVFTRFQIRNGSQFDHNADGNHE